MLKRLTLRNFVHFQDEQTFTFNEGSYFFIGENKSGKTSSFEAIRRCMSTSKNLFMSTSHDRSQPSFVICEYASSHTNNGQLKTIYSCIVGVPAETEESSNEIKVKIFIDSGEKNVYVDLLKKNKYGYPVNTMFRMDMNDDTHRTSIQALIETKISTESLDSFVFDSVVNTEFYQSFVTRTLEQDYDPTTDCEKYLKETVDKDVVMTEPMRSVIALQWTNSPKFDNLPRTHAGCNRLLQDMGKNSEILFWYLDNQDIREDERQAVDDLFDLLTEGSRIRFEKKDGTIQVIDNGNVITLEKAPEGLLEAKICSILLSLKQFKTICLEEPGKGMHVQMIERLRDLVLKDIEGKTIILINHNPAFLISRSIENIFFFRRQPGEHQIKVIPGNDILPAREHTTRRIMVDHNISTIFFASHVLLVEGLSEELFVSAMKSILLREKDLANAAIQGVAPTLTSKRLHQFLCSLHILKLGGERNKLRFEKICSGLNLKRYFILDYDAIDDNQEGTKKFFREFAIEDVKSEFTSKGVTVLESKGIFVWKKPAPGSEKPNQKGGTIEDAMIQLIDKHGELKSLFIGNTAALNWDFEKKKNKKKLFHDRNLTDDNIHNVVRGVIQACLEHTDSDVFRLIKFLIRSAATQNGNG